MREICAGIWGLKMKVPDVIRKTVAFACYHNKVTDRLEPIGSAFFVGHNPKQGETISPRCYVVTAKHVLDSLRVRGCEEIGLRLNSNTDQSPFIEIRSRLDAWFTHPTDPTIDVAILQMGIPKTADHLVIPFSLAATPQNLADQEVGVGDEVFISGLFRHHFGNKKNIPIIRVGNLAALNEERIQTSLGEADAYLIEARSLGGLSGSPVFVNLGTVRHIGGETKFSTGGSMLLLLGLVHGHIDGNAEAEKINSGIAIVVPIAHVLDVIEKYETQHELKSPILHDDAQPTINERQK
jgi:hypothetical protein